MKLTPTYKKFAHKQNRKFATNSVADLMTEGAVEGRKAVLVLQVLQFVAHDIWGSADLHFDGDCSQEHEWHVIMRGGVFMNTRRSHASGKTALEAVLAAADVKLKEAKKWAKPKRFMHEWNQIDMWHCIAEALEKRLPIVRKMDSDQKQKELCEALDADIKKGKKRPCVTTR